MAEQYEREIDAQGRRIVDLLEERGYEEEEWSPQTQQFRGEETLMELYSKFGTRAGIHFNSETEDLSYVTLKLCNVQSGIHGVEPDEVKEAIEYFQNEERVRYGEFIVIEPQETPEETEELVEDTLDAAQTMEKLGIP